MTNNNNIVEKADTSVAERSQRFTSALSSYARALTFENRSRRNLYRLAGLAPKARDRAFSILLILSFVLFFAAPFSMSVIYYGLLASPQYSSEVRFVVRSSVPLLSRDRYSSSNAEPRAKIIQDTAVLLNYLESPEIVKDLQEEIDFDALFGRDGIDFLSRLETNASRETLLEHWEDHYESTVNPKSGIVELKIWAFSAEEARDLLVTVMALAERLVNELNTGIWENLKISAQNDVRSATVEIETMRIRMRDLQNKTGIFDVELSAESILAVLTKIETELSSLRTERKALLAALPEDSLQIKSIDKEISAREVQAEFLRKQTAGGGGAEDRNLAEYSRMFDQAKLDLELAEDRLRSAIEELEKVNLISSLQLIYLDAFTEPTLSYESNYPKTGLAVFLSLVFTLMCWGAVAGVIILVRNKID